MTNTDKKTSITIVAVGPGDPRFLTLRGREALRQADLVVGFKTVLDVVQQWTGAAAVRPMSYRDQEQVLEDAAAQAAQGLRCVVCCWGDLNVSAAELLRRVRNKVDEVELIPGVSSIQIACARAGIPLEESLFITLHQRKDSEEDLEELVRYLKENRRNIILLPRPWDLMPPPNLGRPADRRRIGRPAGDGLPAADPGRRGTMEGQSWRLRRIDPGVQRPVHNGVSSQH